MSAVALLFSGGTDSTCAAALMASSCRTLHLLTYYESATSGSVSPVRHAGLLRGKFPDTEILHRRISVDRLVRWLSYSRYLRNLYRHKWLVLANPAYSSLSWHTRTIVHCVDNGISKVADGLTRELMHFPGHMDECVALIRALYADFGIDYCNPVREWPTPPDQQFLDRMIVNSHAQDFFLGDQGPRKSTGKYLHELGIFPAANIKGSRLDFAGQHECYPFAIYNVLAFWGCLPRMPYEVFCARIASLLEDKIAEVRPLLREYVANGARSRLAERIEDV